MIFTFQHDNKDYNFDAEPKLVWVAIRLNSQDVRDEIPTVDLSVKGFVNLNALSPGLRRQILAEVGSESVSPHKIVGTVSPQPQQVHERIFKNGTGRDPITDPELVVERVIPRVLLHDDLNSFIGAMAEFRTAAALGEGTLLPCDDPRSRRIGFVHHPKEGESFVHEIGLRAIKGSNVSENVASRIGLKPDDIRDLLATYDGRHFLITGHPTESVSTPEQDKLLQEAMMADPVQITIVEVKSEGERVTNVEFPELDLFRGSDTIVPTLPQTPARRPRSNTPAIKGWSRFDYPEDRERLPMITTRGEVYDAQFSGLYKRLSDSVLVIPDGGKGFKAQMSSWTMADKDLTKIGGYVIPDGVDISNAGLDHFSQAFLLLTPQ